MIDWLSKRYSILSASQYRENYLDGTLENTDICLSFDDALKCQYEIAAPLMEKLGIEAFFLYTVARSAKALTHWKYTGISEPLATLILINFTETFFIWLSKWTP